MNSKSLIDDRRQIPVYNVDPSQGKNPRQQRIQCVPRKDFEDLDAERRRLRQALIDRGVNPNDIPAVPNPTPPQEALLIPTDDSNVVIRMPRYVSHKVVWALKIKEIHPGRQDGQGPGQTLHFTENVYSPVSKADYWIGKFKPEEGGYYVVYEDGYSSFSPAKAFEEGYTRIDGKLG
jgi:hypothetical protein